MTDKADVELRIRQAQAAVLNNRAMGLDFLSMTEDMLKESAAGEQALSFSRNVVCVDLEGPNLTDLSFIDLPGNIALIPCQITELTCGQVSFRMLQTT